MGGILENRLFFLYDKKSFAEHNGERSEVKNGNTDNYVTKEKLSDDKQKKDKRAEKEYDDNGEADESGFHSVVEEYMIPLSDSEELDKDYVKNMSDHDLRIAINEMYARYGYHFKNKDLQDYFNSTSWYSDKGITDQSEIKDVMSELELYNLEILTDERNRRQ